MKHARPDYNRIQDPDGLIPEDEPVFLIRGQDTVGAHAVRAYANLLAAQPGADQELVNMCHRQADAMDAWPKKKVADLPSTSGPISNTVTTGSFTKVNPHSEGFKEPKKK